MSELCDAVKSEMDRLFAGEVTTTWEVTHDSLDSCGIRASQILVAFNVDPRDRSISSSITYLNIPEEEREPLYTHVIDRLFASPESDHRIIADSFLENVALEANRVHGLLVLINKNNLSPRDLLYFQNGYSAAYTDFASGRWGESLQ